MEQRLEFTPSVDGVTVTLRQLPKPLRPYNAMKLPPPVATLELSKHQLKCLSVYLTNLAKDAKKYGWDCTITTD